MIDYEATMKAIGNDRTLFETLVQIFLEDYPALLDNLGHAVTGESHEAVYSAAHRLKGLVSNFHAKDLVDILAEIEVSARSTESTSTASAVQHISMLCANMATELKSRLAGA
jgi:HPt (histidine-containing phosphotransfer) domain-containing protein